MKEYNVAYDTNNGTKIYLMCWCDKNTALHYVRKCRERYVGKAYPNKKGFYDVRNVRLIEREIL